MKRLEVNERLRKKQRGLHICLLISQLLIALEYQTLYQSNAKTKPSYHMGRYEKNLICIFMKFKENIKK